MTEVKNGMVLLKKEAYAKAGIGHFLFIDLLARAASMVEWNHGG